MADRSAAEAPRPRAAYLGNPHDSPVWEQLSDELDRAIDMHGPMASGHEAVAVIEEEFLEFRSAVFWGVDQKGRPSDPRNEALQLAAMAVRYLVDVGHDPDDPIVADVGRLAIFPQVGLDELPIIDASHDCEACRAQSSEFYDLDGRCLTCGQRFTVRMRKGDKPPLSIQCPKCEVSEFSWRSRAELRPREPGTTPVRAIDKAVPR